MIIQKRKPFEEIRRLLAHAPNVFLAGCSDCATTCKVGGQEELDAMETRLADAGLTVTGKHVFDTACLTLAVRRGIAEHADAIDASDAVLVLCCGTGLQTLDEQLQAKPLLPGVESLFVGSVKRLGKYEEVCMQCGECILERTAGLCPVTRCPKGLRNGPCGGYSAEGKCEVDPNRDCIWLRIYERLAERGQLGRMRAIVPSQDYQSHHHPRAYEWEKPRPRRKRPARG